MQVDIFHLVALSETLNSMIILIFTKGYLDQKIYQYIFF